jgi:hypothetical protein
VYDGVMLLSAADDPGLRDDWRHDDTYTQALGNALFVARTSLGL